jgi:hypothetical protein
MNVIKIFDNFTKKDKKYSFQIPSNYHYTVGDDIGWSLSTLLYNDIFSDSIHIDLRYFDNYNQEYNKFFFKFTESKKTKIILIISLLIANKHDFEKFEEIINFIDSYSSNRNILLIIDECYEGTEKRKFDRYESLLKEKFNDNFFIVTGNKYTEKEDNYIYYNIFKFELFNSISKS